jgi:hypothetical protein
MPQEVITLEYRLAVPLNSLIQISADANSASFVVLTNLSGSTPYAQPIKPLQQENDRSMIASRGSNLRLFERRVNFAICVLHVDQGARGGGGAAPAAVDFGMAPADFSAIV